MCIKQQDDSGNYLIWRFRLSSEICSFSHRIISCVVAWICQSFYISRKSSVISKPWVLFLHAARLRCVPAMRHTELQLQPMRRWEHPWQQGDYMPRSYLTSQYFSFNFLILSISSSPLYSKTGLRDSLTHLKIFSITIMFKKLSSLFQHKRCMFTMFKKNPNNFREFRCLLFCFLFWF